MRWWPILLLAASVQAKGIVPKGRYHGRGEAAPRGAAPGTAARNAAYGIVELGPEADDREILGEVRTAVARSVPDASGRGSLPAWLGGTQGPENAPRPSRTSMPGSTGPGGVAELREPIPPAGTDANLIEGRTKGADDLDLKKVVFVKGVSIAGWEVTSRMTSVRVNNKEGICTEHSQSGLWPRHPFFDSDAEVEGTQWVFARIKGKWYGGAGEWIRPGQVCKHVVPISHVGKGVFYDTEPLRSWTPRSGELVGLAVSAPARAGQWGEAERSNVVLIRWP